MIGLTERLQRIGAAHGRDWSGITSEDDWETAVSQLIEDRYDEGFCDGERDKDSQWTPTLPMTAA